MARDLTLPDRANQLYGVGTHGPFVLTGGFSGSDSKTLEVTMPIMGWPNANPLFTLSIQWDDREPTVWTVTGPRGRSLAKFKLTCEHEEGGKRVTDALIKMTVLLIVHTEFRTRLSARVV